MLLIIPTAIAGKPTHSLPHPSASRRVGPESLAHAGRRHSERAETRAPKRARTGASISRSRRREEAASASRGKKQKPSRSEAKTSRVREVATRRGRGARSSPNPKNEELRAIRAGITMADQPTRSNHPSIEKRSDRMPVRAAARLAKPDDQQDPDSAVASAQQAFGSLSPLKSVEQEAGTPVLLPNLRVASLYDSRGRLVVPAPLYGSHEILLRQNQMADRDGLDRIRDDAGLEQMLREKKLVALPAGEMLQVDDRLPSNRRYSRPWTAAFLSVLSRDYYANFQEPLQVTSAVRTVQVQQRLERTNGNAAPSSGENASPHLTGQAIDIAKHGLTMTQIAWLRTYLQPLIGDGKIDVEEEFRQACFHISVYRKYLPTEPRVAVAASQQEPAEDRP